MQTEFLPSLFGVAEKAWTIPFVLGVSLYMSAIQGGKAKTRMLKPGCFLSCWKSSREKWFRPDGHTNKKGSRSAPPSWFPVTVLFAGVCEFLAEADLSVVDPDIETALRVITDPCFVTDRSAVPSVIRERYKHSLIALQASGKIFQHNSQSSPFRGPDFSPPSSR